jgi:hypothetical protein
MSKPSLSQTTAAGRRVSDERRSFGRTLRSTS